MCTVKVKPRSVASVLFAAALLFCAPACAPGAMSFAWHDPLALRSSGVAGKDLIPTSSLDDPEVVLNNASYTKLAVTHLFLREVGLAPGETAIVGFSLRGALVTSASGAAALLQGVSEPVTVDAAGGLDVKPAFAVEAFAFSSELTLELTVVRVDATVAAAARKALAEATSPLWPYDEHSVSGGRALFAALIGLPRAGQHRWRTRILLRERRPGMLGPLLMAGRSILFFQPPPQAPALLRDKVTLRLLATRLGMHGDAPVWKGSDAPFRDVPYLVLALDRAPRLGWKEHPVYRKLAELDAHIEAATLGAGDSVEKAQATLGEVAQAMLSPDVFMAPEKEFLKTLLDLRRFRLAIAEAQKKHDVAEQILQRNKLAELLEMLTGRHGGNASPMLTPAELLAFAMEATRLRLAVKAATAW